MGIISLAIIKLCLVTILGFFLSRKKYIDTHILKFLTFYVIYISVPFLYCSNLLENLPGTPISELGVFLLISLLIFFTGFSLGWLFSRRMPQRYQREFISTVSFQNCGYLPMTIAYFLFSAGVKDKFLVYVFLYTFGFNIILWSIGSFFIFKEKGHIFNWKSFFTPPVTGVLLAVFLVYTHLFRFIPSTLLVPVKMIGDTSFVFSMIILGCWLARVDIHGFYKKIIVMGKISFLKLGILPLLCLLILLKLKIFSLFGFFILLQTTMPAAASLPIVVNLRGADSEFVSQGVFITHLLSIFTVPFWLGTYLKLSGFSF